MEVDLGDAPRKRPSETIHSSFQEHHHYRMGSSVHHEGNLIAMLNGPREASFTPESKRNERKDASIFHSKPQGRT